MLKILAYTASLGLILRTTNVGTQKIDGWVLKTNRITTARFLVQDKFGWIGFFKKTFLLTVISMKVILGIIFFFLAMQTYILIQKGLPKRLILF